MCLLFMNIVKLLHDYEKQCNIELNCCVPKLHIIYPLVCFVLKQFLFQAIRINVCAVIHIKRQRLTTEAHASLKTSKHKKPGEI